MWTVLGSWWFVLAAVGMAAGLLFAACRRGGGVAWLVAGVIFLAATAGLVSYQAMYVTVGDSVQCGPTLDEARDAPEEPDLGDAPAGQVEKLSAQCRDASRTRYALLMGGYLVLVLGASGLLAARSRSRAT